MSGAKVFKVEKIPKGYRPVKLKYKNEIITLDDLIDNTDESQVKLKCIYCNKITDLQVEAGNDIGLIVPVCETHYLRVFLKQDIIEKMVENIKNFILI